MSRVRRNVSPSTTKQGPIKAVIAFSLKNNASASRSSNSSPRGNDRLWSARKSPDQRSSPERRSPGSPSQKDKSKSHRHSPVQYLSPSAWRASSADPLVPYLTGQWPKDINSYHHYHSGGVFMCDKSTQTIDDLEHIPEKKKSKGHRRSASFGQGDLSKEVIKQRLQKTKEGSRYDSGKQRLSPVAGVHTLSHTAPPTVFAALLKTIIIPTTSHIPTRQNMNRFQRNSVEGLNVEIEKLVLSKPGTTSSAGQEPEEPEVLRAQDIPDGHRAPIPEVTRLSCTRSVDTQTPSARAAEEVQPTSAGAPPVVANRPDSVSPAVAGALAPPSYTTDLLHPECRSDSLESKSSKGDSEYGSPEPSKFVSSPKLEKSCPFVRLPPDGCEKVKVIEESRPSIKEPLLFCPVKPNQFVFKPSQGSAFCPLIKHYLSESGDLSAIRPSSAPLSVSVAVPPASALNQSPTIEGQ
ncbi:glucocorticoid-induced transcript 1 protein-like [Littorina saxatilis]|uniref:Glucocorticoid-induced transcript 1 protein n=1 Tax=Littorina saxatilis TaxID=31220 RepID=A0AAN9BPM9_9CAEN